MRGWQGLGIACLVGFMGWAISREDSAPAASTRPEVVDAFSPIARSPQTLAASEAKKTMVNVEKAESTPLAVAPEVPFKYQAELESFSRLRAKVFLNENDEAERRRLLNDSSLLRALGLRLTEASLAESVMASQDAAVDFLIEAMKSGDKVLASEIARAVIEDPQVENASLERSVRENLAGLKAEVLYHWAAQMPDDAAGVERYLPGPVSQKIWSNVSRRHHSNTAESAEEIAQRHR